MLETDAEATDEFSNVAPRFAHSRILGISHGLPMTSNAINRG